MRPLQSSLSGFSAKSADGPGSTRPAPSGWAIRKKGTNAREWLVLDAAGKTEMMEAGRQAIMRRTGLPARDLRILDPLLSYPSTILGRERAIVINLEHIKAIITAQEVLLLNSRDPFVIPFVEELQRRILHRYHNTQAQQGNVDDSLEPQSSTVSLGNTTMEIMQLEDQDGEEDKAEGKQEHQKRDSMSFLPFEFVALETCLEAACSVLENEAEILEQEANAALDKLTSRITTLNLERVRQIKSRLVSIIGRVQKVRDELENLLDDDEDMAEMYLTEKLGQQQLDNNSSSSSTNDKDDMDNQVLQPDINDRIAPEISLEPSGGSADNQGTQASTTNSSGTKQLHVEELEMLLGAYFAQINGTLNKLAMLREYVDDTEDYINIMLDDKQNNLLKMGVLLATATLVLGAFILVTGILSINIDIEFFDKGGQKEFLWTICGGTAGCIFLYVVAVAWYKHKQLLE